MENKLTTEQVEEKKVLLESINNTFAECVEKTPSSLATDKDRLDRLLSDDVYDYARNAFWDYFKQKYTIGPIEPYYNNKIEMMRDIYIQCLVPLNLKLDVNYGRDQDMGRQTLLSIKRIWFSIISAAQRWYLGVIGFVAFFFACALSRSYAEQNEPWLSSLLLGVAGSILAAMIVSFINKHIQKTAMKLEAQERFVEQETISYLEGLKRDTDHFINSDKKPGPQYMLDFVQINNRLDHYLRSIGRIEQIKALDEFNVLVDFEKMIFDFSSRIVRRDATNSFSDVSPEERSTLRLRVFELTSLVDNYRGEIEEFLFSLKNKIRKISNKSIE